MASADEVFTVNEPSPRANEIHRLQNLASLGHAIQIAPKRSDREKYHDVLTRQMWRFVEVENGVESALIAFERDLDQGIVLQTYLTVERDQ